MIELILVRHGETDSNKKGTYLGWTDAELNGTGIKQAHCAAEKLKDIKAGKIFASPFKRTMKTAVIINESIGTEIVGIPDLKERNFGVWDDLTYDEIITKYPDQYSLYEGDWINFRMPGGESSQQVYERVVRFFDGLVNGHNSGTFIIVTHLGCIRMALAYLLGMTIEGSWRFRVDNCGVVKIQINDEKYAYLTALNI